MNHFKRILSCLLILLIIASITACSGDVSKSDTYLSKGAFYDMFISENDIDVESYDVQVKEDEISFENEEKLFLDLELIDNDQKGGYDSAVTKELVAQICVRYVSFRKTCNPKIKDIDKCHDKQAIRDGVGMKFFELENGYFEAKKSMTSEECLDAINKMKDYERNVEFEDSNLDVKFKDDVESFDGVTVNDVQVVYNESGTVENLSCNNNDTNLIMLSNHQKNNNIINLSTSYLQFKEFKITIPTFEYERDKSKYVPGKKFSYNPYNIGINSSIQRREFMAGIIKSVDVQGKDTFIILEQADIEDVIDLNDKDLNENKTFSVNPKDKPQKESGDFKEGLSFDTTETGVVATYNHTFKWSDDAYSGKSKWRNQAASPTLSLTAKIDNFKVTTTKIGKLLSKKKDGEIKLSFDSSVDFYIDAGGLRYSQADIGNTKSFWTGLKKSRWTGADAGGSEEIKIGSATFPLGSTGFDINVDFYLYIHLDGSLEVTVKNTNVFIISGKTGIKNESEKPTKTAEINANLAVGVHSIPTVRFWGYILADTDTKLELDLDAQAGIYTNDEEEEELTSNVYATESELSEQKDIKYCISTTWSIKLSGQFLTEKSLLGEVINALKIKIPPLEKTWTLSSSHFEDGHLMTSCSRGNKAAVKLNNNGKISLETEKVILNINDTAVDKIISMPMTDKKLATIDKGVECVVSSKGIVKATYDSKTKSLKINALKDGSTEITLKVKKSKNSKKYYKTTISVTVNGTATAEGTSNKRYDAILNKNAA